MKDKTCYLGCGFVNPGGSEDMEMHLVLYHTQKQLWDWGFDRQYIITKFKEEEEKEVFNNSKEIFKFE